MNNDLIRCFVAITIPSVVLSEIAKFRANLKRISPEVRWVKVAAIHVTLKFLGEIEPELVDRIKESLRSISSIAEPFTLTVRGSGCFPSRQKPRVFWLGLEQDGDHSLNRIHRWMEDILQKHGFEKEKRRFSPHLTLGRVKKPQNFTHLFKYMDKHPFAEMSFEVNEIVFMQSILRATGAEYTPIKVYRI
jgi:2'-5' RNA ligase